ncbi:hypothetical protein HanIR_Chr06g0285041 [Helianthus annuus]|nr:hypothetical protein HanIR_Chr06g0285041 [Helianthus annuus]
MKPVFLIGMFRLTMLYPICCRVSSICALVKRTTPLSSSKFKTLLMMSLVTKIGVLSTTLSMEVNPFLHATAVLHISRTSVRCLGRP